MVEVTVQFPEQLAQRIQPIRQWLPTIVELSLAGFRTPAVESATEIIRFLETNPSPAKILDYHASNRSQQRLRRLLALNELGILGESEQIELDEMEKIEHIMIMLKTQVAKQL